MDTLSFYDMDALADAVRRDMRHEQELARSNDGWKVVHEFNVHKAKQILETIKPKHTTR